MASCNVGTETSFIIAICLCCCANPNSAFADGKPNKVLEKILKVWEHRQTRIARIKYELECETLTSKGSLDFFKEDIQPPPGGDVPLTDCRYQQQITMLFDLDKNLIRKELSSQIFDCELVKYVPDIQLKTYDGGKVYVFKPRKRLEKAAFSNPTHKDLGRTKVVLPDFLSGDAESAKVEEDRGATRRWHQGELHQVVSNLRATVTFLGIHGQTVQRHADFQP